MPPHEPLDEPPWGAEGWPRPDESGLDEGDLLLIRSWLAMTPLERLKSLERMVNDLMRPATAVQPAGDDVVPS